MKKLKSLLFVGAFATFLGIASAPAAFAQSELQQSTFTLTEPLDVGTATLQPGTYLIKVVLIDSNRDMLQVTDMAGTKVFTTVLSRPHPILPGEIMPESRYVTWATPAGQPKALRTWYPRDRSTGHDIVYPKARAMELAAAAKEPVIAYPDAVTVTEYKSAPLIMVTPEREVKPYEAVAVQAPPKAAPVAVVAEARPSEQLPETASRIPLFAAMGLLSLGAAFGLRALANRTA
ncbi:MAG: hypothetical protein HY900_32135 [Deltaproteobacteria bacterium]|nr:hypothetical protein [Deltaproteobacteria bacterium]